MSNKLWTPSWAPGQFPDQVWQGPIANEAKRGMELVDLKKLGFLPGVMGGAGLHGTNVAADVVTQTASGTPLNTVWADFMSLLNAVNAERQALIRFLTFSVANPVEMVAQSGTGVDFEEASEFGEPVGARVSPTYFNMGYTFKWYDLAGRYTWQYLADATDYMINSVGNAAVEAYYRKQMFEVFKTVFNPTNLSATINGNAYTVYKFYNNDGTVPPTYKTNTFTSSHQHYRTTGAGTLVAGDLDEMLDDFAAHGYSADNGYRTVIMVHKTQGDVIRTFRSTANGGTGKYDFLPAQGQPGQLILTTQQVIGATQASPTLDGLNVIGTYGVAIIVQDDWLPSAHVFGFTTGGADSLSNPVGIREHANTALRGLRLVKGRNPDYPLIDSFWNFGFGTGIRHRGAGMVMEVTADATYDPPAEYV